MDMKYVERAPFSVRTRTRYARLRFSNDPNAPSNCLKASTLIDCDCSEKGLKTLPEWLAVNNKQGSQYKCNITNLLEVGSWKVSDDYTDGYQDYYYMISKTGAFFIYMEEMSAFYTIIGSLSRVTALPLIGKDSTHYAIFAKGRFLLGNTDGTYEVIISSDAVPAGVFFRHRVFVGMKNGVVKYSAPEDFTNFNESVEEGGSIRFANGGGEIVAMKVFEDALYVFFEAGIVRLSVGGDPCEFHAEKIDYMGGTIYARTVCVCNHAIYFITQDGIYRLQGKKVERLPVQVTLPYKESHLEGCAVWKGMPLFRYKQIRGGFKTLAIRPDGTAYYMMDLEGLCKGENGKVLFVDKAKGLCQLVDGGMGTTWLNASCSTLPTDFGCAGRKTVRKLRFFGEGELEVGLSNGKKSRSKALTFVNGVAEWPLAERGENFVFHFTLGRASALNEVDVEFETVASYKEEK